jgi:hypothetical protein
MTIPPREPRARTSFAVFWASYLLHHEHPRTRMLHSIGTMLVFAGFAASLSTLSIIPALVALVLGYACAFTGHWYVERNEPLTLKSPIRAGLCNLRLFALECLGVLRIGGGYEGAVRRALAVVPLALVEACCDVGDS